MFNGLLKSDASIRFSNSINLLGDLPLAIMQWLILLTNRKCLISISWKFC
jgi:hypothetical protein